MAVLGHGPTDLDPDLQTDVAAWLQIGPNTTDLLSCHRAASDLVSLNLLNSLSRLNLRAASSMWTLATWTLGCSGCHPQNLPCFLHWGLVGQVPPSQDLALLAQGCSRLLAPHPLQSSWPLLCHDNYFFVCMHLPVPKQIYKYVFHYPKLDWQHNICYSRKS